VIASRPARLAIVLVVFADSSSCGGKVVEARPDSEYAYCINEPPARLCCRAPGFQSSCDDFPNTVAWSCIGAIERYPESAFGERIRRGECVAQGEPEAFCCAK